MPLKLRVVFLSSNYFTAPLAGAAQRDRGILGELVGFAGVHALLVAQEKIPQPALPKGITSVTLTMRERAPLTQRLLYPFRPYVLNGYSKNVENSLRELYRPGSVLWISRLTWAQYIEIAQRIGYKVILDEHNVESAFLREAIRTSSSWTQLPRAWQLAACERRFCEQANAVLVTSARDQALLRELAPRSVVTTIPNCIALPPPAPEKSARARGPIRLLFVGTLNYQPNVEGLRWFVHEVWPSLRAAGFQFEAVGSRPSPELRNFLSAQGITVHADVPDLAPFYQPADIAIVPLLSGGGTRIKILEALARGKAVVSTAKGAEGLDLLPNQDLRIADSPAGFAAAVQELAQNPDLRVALGRNGREKVTANYIWPAQRPRLEKILGQL